MVTTRGDRRYAASRFLGVVGLFATGLAACAQDPDAAVPRPKGSAWMELHRRFVERGKQEMIAKEGPVDLLFLGDSITQGWNENNVWQRFYGPRHAANFGIGGDRTQHVLWRIQNGELDGIEPKVVVLMIGTNNLHRHRPTRSPQGIKTIVAGAAHRLPKTRDPLAGRFSQRSKARWALRERLKAINDKIARLDDGVARPLSRHRQGVLERRRHDLAEIMPDYLHLSTKGYRIWADAMEPTLWSMLDEPTNDARDPQQPAAICNPRTS